MQDLDKSGDQLLDGSKKFLNMSNDQLTLKMPGKDVSGSWVTKLTLISSCLEIGFDNIMFGLSYVVVTVY